MFKAQLMIKVYKYFNNFQYIVQEMEGSHSNLQSKKLYEVVLANGVEPEVKKEAVLSIIKMALSDNSNFSFLLNQVHWFCESNVSLIPLLAKVLRAYRGTSKTAPKVVYNLLAEGLSIPNINMIVVDLLATIIQSHQDQPAIIECLKENYPHKVCSTQSHIAYVDSLLELSQRVPSCRFDMIEIIIENLAAFDTEMTLGKDLEEKFECPDQDILDLREQCGELQHKYDEILSRVLAFFASYDAEGKETLLKQVFLIFEKVMMAVDKTKMIQCLIFYLAQTSSQHSSSFLTLLMVTIFQNYSNKTSKRKFISALQYLRSYLNKSLVVPEKNIKKIFLSLLSQLKQNIKNVTPTLFEELNLNQFGQENVFNLYILQTLLYMNWRFSQICQNAKTQKLYSQILKEAEQKLHYGLFIDSSLLLTVGVSQNITKYILAKKKQDFSTKYVEKFLFVFLPKTQTYIKMKQNLSLKRKRPNWTLEESGDMQQENVNCKKMHSTLSTIGGRTPLHTTEIEI